MFEIKSPGFGVPGIGGLICLGLFFGSHLLVGLADITEILILAAGIILILAEIFIVPGFGITGIGGIGLLLYGLFLILIGEYPQYTDYINAFWGLNIGFIGAIIAIFMFFKFLVKSKFYKNLNPVQNQKKSDGFSISVGYEDLIGKLGVTKTALRPVGIIMISGKEYHCRSKGDFIESNMTIKVEGIEENELIVSKK